ncbi:glycerophosphodiester phosphodiesterase family protein [Streptomyces sp. NPDC048002]|uniref:glycerophosphodiester phosphodiesterase n=1 Tax=Streptomyces sp. NPDC048002 TaxID=3154344 RepID=UPI0033C403D5
MTENHLRWVHELAPELPLGLLTGTLHADPVAVAEDLHLTSYNPSGAALEARPETVHQLHDAGVAIMVWTIDSAAKWKLYDEYGVDAIITNRPTELIGWTQSQAQQVTPATAVTVTSPADGAQLDRAQRPVIAVDVDNAEAAQTVITVDGVPREAGEELALTELTAGEHTLTVKATGPSGTATATSTFTVKADRAGLGHLILASRGKQSTVSVLLTQLAHGKYSLLARTAELAARQNALPASAAKLIASDARQLDSGTQGN